MANSCIAEVLLVDINIQGSFIHEGLGPMIMLKVEYRESQKDDIIHIDFLQIKSRLYEEGHVKAIKDNMCLISFNKEGSENEILKIEPIKKHKES